MTSNKQPGEEAAASEEAKAEGLQEAEEQTAWDSLSEGVKQAIRSLVQSPDKKPSEVIKDLTPEDQRLVAIKLIGGIEADIVLNHLEDFKVMSPQEISERFIQKGAGRILLLQYPHVLPLLNQDKIREVLKTEGEDELSQAFEASFELLNADLSLEPQDSDLIETFSDEGNAHQRAAQQVLERSPGMYLAGSISQHGALAITAIRKFMNLDAEGEHSHIQNLWTMISINGGRVFFGNPDEEHQFGFAQQQREKKNELSSAENELLKEILIQMAKKDSNEFFNDLIRGNILINWFKLYKKPIYLQAEQEAVKALLEHVENKGEIYPESVLRLPVFLLGDYRGNKALADLISRVAKKLADTDAWRLLNYTCKEHPELPMYIKEYAEAERIAVNKIMEIAQGYIDQGESEAWYAGRIYDRFFRFKLANSHPEQAKKASEWLANNDSRIFFDLKLESKFPELVETATEHKRESSK